MAIITSEQIQSVLGVCYERALNGIPMGRNGVVEFAEEYQHKHEIPKDAANELVKWQIVKCGTSGFVSGLGGLFTMPVTLPANIISVLYIQLKMVAAIAYLGGYNPADDRVRTMAYLYLVGNSIGGILKQVGINVANKLTQNALEKLPGTILMKINKLVGMRLLTKFGSNGVINLVKLVPFAGALVGMGLDVASTKIIAKQAIKLFIDNPYTTSADTDNEPN